MRLIASLFVSAALLSAQQITPDPTLTPGAVLNVTAADVCVVGYSKTVRNVPIALKRRVYREYGVRYVKGQDEVDHLIPLSWGGGNGLRNLWPEPYDAIWGARQKDDLEWAGYRKTCRGTLSLEEAQREIATDWIGTYKRVFHTNVPRRMRRKAYFPPAEHTQ